MGALDGIGRVIVVIVNLVFLLIGLALFAGGLVVKFGSSLYESQIKAIEKSIEQSVSSAGLGTVDIDLNIASILEPASIALICSGLLIVILCIFGCCGACYKVKVMLISYAVIVGVLLAGQIIVVALLFGSPSTFQNSLKSSLKSGIKSEYRGLNGTNLVSMGWNVVMQNMKCCGVDSYDDFTGATNWITSYTYGMTTYNLVTPLSCCKDLPSSSDLSCASSPSDANNYWKTSCFTTIWNIIFGNVGIMVGVLVGVAVFQLLLIVFAIIIFCKARKNKVGV